MKLIKKNTKKGFTLIELVIVIAILAILALILVPTIGSYTEKANKSKVESSVRSIYTEAILAINETDFEDLGTTSTTLSGKYPGTVIIQADGTNYIVRYDDGKFKSAFNGKNIAPAVKSEAADPTIPVN